MGILPKTTTRNLTSHKRTEIKKDIFKRF